MFLTERKKYIKKTLTGIRIMSSTTASMETSNIDSL